VKWSTKTILVALAWSLVLPGVVVSQPRLSVVVEALDLMPQGRASDGRGIMTDAVMEAIRRAGMTGTLEFLPWRRAQDKVAGGKDLLITALSRTLEREAKFTWIFPVIRYDRTFVTTGKIYTSFAEAKASLKGVIVTLGSAQYDILIREGFSPAQLLTVEPERQSIIPTMLLAGHGDAWFVVRQEVPWSLKGEPQASQFVIGPPLGQGTDQYVAASKDCNPEIVARLKTVAAEMVADGTMAEIVRRYQ